MVGLGILLIFIERYKRFSASLKETGIFLINLDLSISWFMIEGDI